MPGKRARRHFSQLSEFERGLIIGMKTAGYSTCRIAGQVDRKECAVRICWEQRTREGTHARKTGSGATKRTTRREDRRIVRQALVDPTVMTRSTIRADVGVAIVPQTISRYLAEANLKSKRSFCALHLTPEHRQLRLQWYQARSIWNVTDWQKVVFSDESRFVLGIDDNRVRVWRHPVGRVKLRLGEMQVTELKTCAPLPKCLRANASTLLCTKGTNKSQRPCKRQSIVLLNLMHCYCMGYPSFPPVFSNDRSASLGFVQHGNRFLGRIVRNPYKLLFFLGRIQKLRQKTPDVFHEG
ncbi:HTH_Tnp_Tc3_2 domain-containing protein [Trichonephila clavipes]|nr:HTH_Tnp_Tc3_2 domain-containing protein [Trichonephila clavipes]